MKNLAVYVHIPFCVKKCNYCDFLSFPAGSDLQQQYIYALLEEIKQAASDCEEYVVRSVFLGGGTPSLPDAAFICQIMDTLRDNLHFAEDAEISMEMNPGTVDADKIALYKKAGINRISIGMQSSKDNELKALGRIHDNKTFLQCYDLVRQAGFKNVNIDVMSALPDQDYDSYMETLQQVVDLKPEHISAYSLIIEEGTPFYDLYEEGKENTLHPLPSEDEERRMYHATKEFLHAHGYERYEISNYALMEPVDYSCRHNTAYWTGADYIGFGLGASSMMKHTRWSNITDIKEYIATISPDDVMSYKKVRTDIDRLSIRAQMEEYMFLGLRMTRGISISGFNTLFGKTIEEVYGTVIEKNINSGLLAQDGDILRLTEYGTDVSNHVMADFLLD